MNRILNKIRAQYWAIAIFAISLVYIVNTRYFISPPLYIDDWTTLIEGNIFTGYKLFDLTNRRPFISILFATLKPIFGLKIQLYYLLNFLFIFAIGVLLFLIIKKIFPGHAWMHLPIVLVALVYPMDFTKTWIIMMNGHFVLLLDLIIILLLLEFTNSGKTWTLILANLLFLFTLGIYEAGLGIVVLTAISLAVKNWKSSFVRSLALLSVVITSVAFIFWRIFIQPQFLNVQDKYLEAMNTSLPTLAYRYTKVLFITLFDWLGPVLGEFGRTKYYVFVVITTVLIGIFLAFLPRLVRNAKSSSIYPHEERKKLIRSLAVIFLFGVFFWAAGYVPIISLTGSAFDGYGSRHNLYAIIGASIALVAGISLLATLFSKSKAWVGSLTVICVIPFIIVGLIYQVWSQNERFKAWEVQKNFWAGMFEAVPGLSDNSAVGIFITGYQVLNQFQVQPLISNWEATSALRVLYNNPDLSAFYYYLDRPVTASNFIPASQDWSRFVLVLYDPEKNTVKVLTHPQDLKFLPSPLAGYQPEKRITQLQPDALTYRWLVR